MLSIVDTDTLLPITELVRSVRGGSRGVSVDITATVIEDDDSLPLQNVAGTIDWNDGNSPTTFSGPSPYALAESRLLAPGHYLIGLVANNYRSPAHDVARINFTVTVEPPIDEAVPPRLIFGPILPRDAGAPNVGQWRFDVASDLLILESSVKMLILTGRGERLMEPDYGTDVRHLLFETNFGGNVESLVREEIVRALAQWEPRVLLSDVLVSNQADNREMTLALRLISRLSQQTFEVTASFAQ